MSNQFGFNVSVRFSPTSPFAGETQIYRNVTEIHWRYSSILHTPGTRVAFESDIHSTGVTYEVSDIAEFEAVIETEEAEYFS